VGSWWNKNTKENKVTRLVMCSKWSRLAVMKQQ
jgi:hypothetical protein